jgi:hypothetical protein
MDHNPCSEIAGSWCWPHEGRDVLNQRSCPKLEEAFLGGKVKELGRGEREKMGTHVYVKV